MSRDILFDDNDMIGISQFGDISMCDNEDQSILQSAIHNIRIKYGELDICQDRGNKLYDRRMKYNYNVSQIENDCTDAIMWDSRVKDVKDMNVVLIDISSFSITFQIVKMDDTIINGDILTSIGG